jgi:hypothetical protein
MVVEYINKWEEKKCWFEDMCVTLLAQNLYITLKEKFQDGNKITDFSDISAYITIVWILTLCSPVDR